MRISFRSPCARMSSVRSNCLLWCGSLRRKAPKMYKKSVSHCDKDILLICSIISFFLVSCIVLLWSFLKDKCDTETIVQNLCQEYNQGKIAGSWCYDICVLNTITLSRCDGQTADRVTFLYRTSVVNVPIPTSNIQHSIPRIDSLHSGDLKEPLSVEEFESLLTGLLHSKLGEVDVSELLEKIYTFSDFNHDGFLSYGEANSIWRLLNIHEFFVLFAFQDDSIFPQMNGTCGSLYSYEYVGQKSLYNKNIDSILDKFVSNSYRWQLPTWKKRANLIVELLDYGITFSERYDSKFFMCDFVSSSFGYTSQFEIKIISFDQILSQYQIGQILNSKGCRKNWECNHGNQCQSTCNVTSGLCSSTLQRPSLVSICEIVKDYLLFDSPAEIKLQLDLMVTKCTSLGKRIGVEEEGDGLNTIYVNFNVLLNNLKQLLWDQIKNQPPGWLKPPKITRKAHV